MPRRLILPRGLTGAFANVDELHVALVTGVLLHVCRRLQAELDQELQRRFTEGLPYGPFLDSVGEIVPDAEDSDDPEFLDREQLDRLLELLGAARDEGDLALRARDAATVIDERRGRHHFFAWFSDRRLVCPPGAPFSVHSADVKVRTETPLAVARD